MLKQPIELQCSNLVCVACCCSWIEHRGELECPCCYDHQLGKDTVRQPSPVITDLMGQLKIQCKLQEHNNSSHRQAVADSLWLTLSVHDTWEESNHTHSLNAVTRRCTVLWLACSVDTLGVATCTKLIGCMVCDVLMYASLCNYDYLPSGWNSYYRLIPTFSHKSPDKALCHSFLYRNSGCGWTLLKNVVNTQLRWVKVQSATAFPVMIVLLNCCYVLAAVALNFELTHQVGDDWWRLPHCVLAKLVVIAARAL